MTAATGPGDATRWGPNLPLIAGAALVTNIVIWLWLWPWFFDNYPQAAWDIFGITYLIFTGIFGITLIISLVFFPLYFLIVILNMFFHWFSKEQLRILPKKNPIKNSRLKATLTLIFIICIFISGSMYWWIWSLDDFPKSTPTGYFSINEQPNGYVITIDRIMPQTYASSLQWEILDMDDNIIIKSGVLSDSLGLDPRYLNNAGNTLGDMSIDSNLSDYGRLAPGTQIYIARESLPPNVSNLSFRLKFKPTGGLYGVGIPFSSAVWNNITYQNPSPRMELTNRTDSNLTIDDMTPLSHAYISYSHRDMIGWELTFRVNNTSDDDFSNSKFELLVDNRSVIIEEGLNISAGEVSVFTFKRPGTFTIENYMPSLNMTARFFASGDELLLEGEIVVPVVRYLYTTPSFSLSFQLLFLSIFGAVMAQSQIARRELPVD